MWNNWNDSYFLWVILEKWYGRIKVWNLKLQTGVFNVFLWATAIISINFYILICYKKSPFLLIVTPTTKLFSLCSNITNNNPLEPTHIIEHCNFELIPLIIELKSILYVPYMYWSEYCQRVSVIRIKGLKYTSNRWLSTSYVHVVNKRNTPLRSNDAHRRIYPNTHLVKPNKFRKHSSVNLPVCCFTLLVCTCRSNEYFYVKTNKCRVYIW